MYKRQPPPPPEPEPEPEPVIVDIETSTYGANTIQYIDPSALYTIPDIKLSITTTDGIAAFDSAQSYVKESSYDSTSNTVEWTYNLAQTPTNYNSLDDFQTTFSSANSEGGDYVNTKINPNGTNIFQTQQDNANFTSSSYTSWGRWELDLLYDDDYEGTTDNEIKSLGYWITGTTIDETTLNDIFSSGFSAIYDGDFIGYYFDTNGNAVDTYGKAVLNANYSQNMGELVLENFMQDDRDRYIPIKVENQELVSSDGSIISAAFFGNGSCIAGSFKLIDKEDAILGNGIFDVSQSAYELPTVFEGLSVSNITTDKSDYWYEDINIDILPTANKIFSLNIKDETDNGSIIFTYKGINISSYTSQYEFSGEFMVATTSSEILTPNSSSITTTPTPNSSYMTWGEWNIDFTYNNGDDTRSITKGLLISGEITPSSVLYLAATNKSFVSYSGTYKAIDLSDNSMLGGEALLDINFAHDSAVLSIDAPSSGNNAFEKTYFDTKELMNDIDKYDEFHALQRDGGGSMSGKFYGTDGMSVGGAFTLFQDTNPISKGIYEVGHGSIKPTKFYLGGGVGIDSASKISMGIEDVNSGEKFYIHNSWFKECDEYSSNIWGYRIETPSSYTSISDFSSTFSDIKAIEDGGNAITNISEPTTNSFNATNDDLDSEDEMSWGEWNVAFTYDQKGETGISRDISGLWVAGVETDPEAIANYSQNNIVYDGTYKAIDLTQDNDIVSGVSRLDVNFGDDTATLTIRNTTNEYDWGVFDISGIKSNASLDGSQQNNDGITRGHFIGATANDAAGDFSIYDSGEAVAKGVYQVHTDTVLGN